APAGPLPATGHAIDTVKDYDYAIDSKNGSATYLNEANTGHKTHARGAAGEHKFTCEQCHKGNTHDALPTPTFQDVFITTTGILASQQGFAPTYNGAAATCGTNVYCHSDGQSARAGGATAKAVPAWLGGNTTCTSCHNVGTTGTATVHATHLALNGLANPVTCDTCHTNTAANGTTLKASALATGGAHVNGVVDVDGAFNTGLPAPAAFASATGTCAIYCHSNGLGTNVQMPDWDDLTTGDCGDCHGSATVGTSSLSGGAAGGHKVHVVDYAVAPFSITCTTCHSHNGAFSGEHLNGVRDYPDTPAETAAACGSCHGSSVPVWNVDATNGNCTLCHGMGVLSGGSVVAGAFYSDTNGDTGTADPQVGTHEAHLTSAKNWSANISCAQCHKTTVTNINAAATYVDKVGAVGHIGSALPAELDFDTLASANGATPAWNGATCATSYCHDGSKIGHGWSGTLNVPDWNTPYFNGTTSHDCAFCHGYPPNPANHPNDSDCSGCHLNIVATDDGFIDPTKHVNGIVETEGGDTCLDCHGSGKYKDPNTANPTHADHTNVALYLTGKKLSTNDYGKTEATWYDVSYDATSKPYMGCGQCHPANLAEHRDGVADVVLYHADPVADSLPAVNAKRNNLPAAQFSGNKCSGVYCHSDGLIDGSYADSPDWDLGTISTCAACHGNSPTSNAHADHVVGIHYEDLYDDDGTGVMAKENTAAAKLASGGADAAHGNSATSATLNCNICHVSTIDVAYNAGNAVCASCHSDTNNAVAGNESAIIKPNSTTHLDGAKSVAFSTLANFRSKAQIRDDITTVAELNTAWSRTAGYKAASGASFDTGKRLPVWDGGAKTCSTTDCHNGNVATWTDSGVNCGYCHTALP
ncbi:MAG: CxxxxCH/CxxCH domain-containing protein, partial [Deltaproteobacteria bacterium]